jgi:hypothetical protein
MGRKRVAILPLVSRLEKDYLTFKTIYLRQPYETADILLVCHQENSNFICFNLMHIAH